MEPQQMLQLAERFRNEKDHGALDSLWAVIGNPIWALVCRKVPRQEAEDVFQDVFLAVAQALARDAVTHIPALAGTIARRNIADFFRTRRPTESLHNDDEGHDPPDPRDLPTFASARVDNARLLAPCNREERQILILHYCAGYTVSEVAQYLDIPTARAKKRIYRAVKKIRDCLSRREAK